jgi:hypothetical protein
LLEKYIGKLLEMLSSFGEIFLVDMGQVHPNKYMMNVAELTERPEHIHGNDNLVRSPCWQSEIGESKLAVLLPMVLEMS